MSTVEGHWGFPRNARIAIIAARFNHGITDRLVEGAQETLKRLGAPSDAIDLVWVPGAFEIPGCAAHLYDRYEAIITLGAVIRGETPHFDYVAGTAANAVSTLAARGEKPVIFGILTCNTPEEAEARAGGKAGNKGIDAALAAVEMLTLYQNLSGA